MTTPDARPEHDGSTESAADPGPAHRGQPAQVDDLESTAVRRQRLLGLGEDAVGETAATYPAAQPETADPAGPGPWTPTISATPATTDHPGAPAPTLRARWQEAPDPTDVALAGASEARPRSRAAAHVWVLVVTVLLTPVAWFLVADAGARLTGLAETAGGRGVLDVPAVAELRLRPRPGRRRGSGGTLVLARRPRHRRGAPPGRRGVRGAPRPDRGPARPPPRPPGPGRPPRERPCSTWWPTAPAVACCVTVSSCSCSASSRTARGGWAAPRSTAAARPRGATSAAARRATARADRTGSAALRRPGRPPGRRRCGRRAPVRYVARERCEPVHTGTCP